MEKTREKIISLIKENKYITTEGLADKTGLSIEGIEWNIQQIKAKKILKRVGSDKGDIGRFSEIRTFKCKILKR